MAKQLTARGYDEVAEFFKSLGDPVRLRLVDALRVDECSVNVLAERLSITQPTASRQLTALERRGILKKRREGAAVYYSIANRRVFELCDIVCAQIEADAKSLQKLSR